MTVRETLSRYKLLINRLRQGGASSAELLDYLERHGQVYDLGQRSLRTLQRDFKDIGELFGIIISYSRSLKKYRIEEEENPTRNKRLLETFDLLFALSQEERFAPYFFLDHRQAVGSRWIGPLLEAIIDSKKVRFNYHKYAENRSTERLVAPLSIKESTGRWYLLANDEEGQFKQFGLDRIDSLQETGLSFTYPATFNPAELYDYSFGVLDPDETPPEEIELSFQPKQGRYVLGYPLHQSQQLLEENEQEIRIGLCLKPTYDFQMELMSQGASVKVLKPKSLQAQIAELHRKAWEQYQHDLSAGA